MAPYPGLTTAPADARADRVAPGRGGLGESPARPDGRLFGEPSLHFEETWLAWSVH